MPQFAALADLTHSHNIQFCCCFIIEIPSLCQPKQHLWNWHPDIGLGKPISMLVWKCKSDQRLQRYCRKRKSVDVISHIYLSACLAGLNPSLSWECFECQQQDCFIDFWLLVQFQNSWRKVRLTAIFSVGDTHTCQVAGGRYEQVLPHFECMENQEMDVVDMLFVVAYLWNHLIQGRCKVHFGIEGKGAFCWSGSLAAVVGAGMRNRPLFK